VMAPMPSGYRVRAALLAVALAVLAGCGGSDDDSVDAPTTGATQSATTPAAAAAEGPQLGPASAPIASLPGATKSGPPWGPNNAASLQLRLRAIGLELLTEEGQVVHIHQHVDLSVDGRQVTIPAQIGVDAGGGFISDLHTHDASGILHVESPTQRDFTLGEFFAVWGLPLSADCIGNRCESGSKRLRVWVDGDEVTGDPTRIVLADHQEIAIAYGTKAQEPDPVPDTYDFAAAGL
jgi:hypothetical protein